MAERPQYVPTSSSGSPSAAASVAAAYSASPSATGMKPLAAWNAARISGLGSAATGSSWWDGMYGMRFDGAIVPYAPAGRTGGGVRVG